MLKRESGELDKMIVSAFRMIMCVRKKGRGNKALSLQIFLLSVILCPFLSVSLFECLVVWLPLLGCLFTILGSGFIFLNHSVGTLSCLFL